MNEVRLIDEVHLRDDYGERYTEVASVMLRPEWREGPYMLGTLHTLGDFPGGVCFFPDDLPRLRRFIAALQQGEAWLASLERGDASNGSKPLGAPCNKPVVKTGGQNEPH